MMANLLALAGAYATAWIAGPYFVPALRFLSFPDPLLRVIAGALAGIVVYVAATVLFAILFKKTSDQSVGIVRLGYGATGAFVGMFFGLFLVWLSVLGIRVLGTLAEGEKNPTRRISADPGRRGPTPGTARPAPWLNGVVQVKNALEKGATGAVVERVDPIPGSIYSLLNKLGAMASDEQNVARFLAYPGVKPLAEHPKITALRDDPQIARDVLSGNYFSLLRNPTIVQAVNDAEILALMRELQFEKALDYSLGKNENGATRHRE